MTIQDFQLLISDKIAGAVLAIGEKTTPVSLIIDAKSIHQVCQELNANKNCYFDMLSCLTVIDNGVQADTMEVIYHLYSIPLEHSLVLYTKIDRTLPKIVSVTDIWQTANWHEREAFDLFGVHFDGHPDLRRILMPADWEGHPMRKDYVEPFTYRGMKTIREEQDPI